MKYTDLSQHLHLLRHEATGRPVGAAMRMSEVWSAILNSNRTSIEEIRFFETELPRPFDGLFVRLLNSDDGTEVGMVYVQKTLDKHWKEFVAIKEMMHCFTPGAKYINGPKRTNPLTGNLAVTRQRVLFPKPPRKAVKPCREVVHDNKLTFYHGRSLLAQGPLCFTDRIRTANI